MKVNFIPVDTSGRWSVGLSTFFLLSVALSVTLVNGFGLLSYGDRWWDITVPIVFSASIIAFILGIRSIVKHKGSSMLVYVSVGLGFLSILFLLLHSLFIND